MTIKDLTEDLVYDLSLTDLTTNYQLSDISFDIAVNNMPFFIASTDEQPYRRESAPYKREQIDQTTEPGEQSFTGWWFRSQSSCHLGAGARFFEPAQDETLRYRFLDSEGVDVWTKGEVSLLKDVDTSHVTTSASLKLRSIRESDRDEALLLDGHDVDKVFARITVSISNKALTSNVATLATVDAHGLAVGMQIVITGVDATFNGEYRVTGVPTTTTFTYAKTASNVTSTAVSPVGTGTSDIIHFIDYNAGTDDPVYAICDDGTTAYWATNDIDTTNKAHLFKKALTGTSATAETLMFNINGYTFTEGKVVMEWVKGRIILCTDNKVCELTPTSGVGVYNNPIFTHTNTSYTFTSVAESGSAIYVAGYAGVQSSIYKFTLSDAGAITSLTSAVVAAQMPDGELIYAIKQYLGYMMIGTSKGIRAATINDQDGSIAYGPLIAETEQPVYDFTFRDRFAWATANVNNKAGIIRIDLSEQISPLRFAYAHDLFKNVEDKECKGVAFLGTSNRKIFSVNSDYNYIESDTRLVENGYLRTGFIRYATIESKYFKFLKVRGDLGNGTIDVSTVTNNEIVTFLYNVAAEAGNVDLGIARPFGAQEYLAFKFTLNRDSVDTTKGAIMSGYQVKALPAIEKQRLIQFPLYCYDVEMDKYNNIVGSEDDRAFDRISELESIEKTGNIVTIQDFRTDETYSALIEEIRFSSATPPSERFNGFGGKLLLLVRKL
jgi:hypothetical protein